MKIALINPPFLFSSSREIHLSQCLGLRSISSFLKMEGRHETYLIDSLMLGFRNIKPYANGCIVGLKTDDIVANIPSDTDLIGISVPFSQLAGIAHNIVDHAKERFPKIPIVMGGIYPSTQPKLALSSKADFIIVGEGESAIKDICDGKDPKKIRGVYSNHFSDAEYFQPASTISNLDELPFPDYSIPLMDRYFIIGSRTRTNKRTASLVTSRGCPFDCEFCSIHPVYGKEYRARSAGKVLEEIKYLVERHSIRSLEIEDDNFTLEKDRTVKILEGIVHLNEKGAGLDWRTPNGIRIDTCDEDVIRLIKKSNCSRITLGLEHGDPEMLRKMNKEIDLDGVFKTIKQFAQQGIPSICLFVIVGYPGETRKSFLNSLSYLGKIKKLSKNIHFFVNIAQPYPGTQLLAKCRREGYAIDENIDNFLIRKEVTNSNYTVSITTPDFDKKEVLFRKRYLLKRLDKRVYWSALVKSFLPIRIIASIRFLMRLFLKP